ncbi:hypothetical protein [Flavobacterium microcysteis]
MADLKREELKKLLSPINKELRVHGGNDSTVKITKLKAAQIDFLLELIKVHLDDYKTFARTKLEEFHAEDIKLVNYKMPVSIHKITLPENEEENCTWELIIGRLRFGSTEIILDLKKWEIIDDTLVG